MFFIANANKTSNINQALPETIVVVSVGALLIAQKINIVKEITIVTMKNIENIAFCLLIFKLYSFCAFFLNLRSCDISSPPPVYYSIKAAINQRLAVVYHQFRKELHIIKTKFCISSSRQIYTLRVMIYASGDDIYDSVVMIYQACRLR